MDYYVYISESKIDMLFSQLSRSEGERREASLGFDLSLVKGELKESRGIPTNKYTRLNAIINQLSKEDMIGTIDEKKPYIKGSLKMTWAPYGFSRKEPSPITFWGYLSKNMTLGVAGSSHHLLGEQAKGEAHSHSLTGAIVEWLTEQFSDRPLDGHEIHTPFGILDNYGIANATWLAVTQMKGQRNTFEFIAKVLHRSSHSEGFRSSSITEIILATPLYVSLVD